MILLKIRAGVPSQLSALVAGEQSAALDSSEAGIGGGSWEPKVHYFSNFNLYSMDGRPNTHHLSVWGLESG